MMTICPGCKLAARTCSIYSSKAVVLADPSRMNVAPMPERDSAAICVVFLPRLRGTCPLARSPLRARAYRGVHAMLEPHSSRKTRSSVGSWLAFSLQVVRSSSLRSVAPMDFFFVSSPDVAWLGSWSNGSHALHVSAPTEHRVAPVWRQRKPVIDVNVLGSRGRRSQGYRIYESLKAKHPAALHCLRTPLIKIVAPELMVDDPCG
jgi:hypothetical protein